MGEQDIPLREIADSRARMSELADELARRMEPEHLKALAAGKVSDLKEQARERVAEKADELKTRAKEAVMSKTTDIKDRADTPRGWSLLGAIIGAGVGSLLMRKAFEARSHSGGNVRDLPPLVPDPERSVRGTAGYTSGYPGTTAHMGMDADNLKTQASGAMDTVKDKALELRERASGFMDRMPDRGEMKTRASNWFDTVVDNPVLLAIGGLGLGALFASFIPVTDRERQLIEPAKAKVKESLSGLGDQLESKLSSQGSDEGVQEDELQSSAAMESQQERGTIPPLPPLDDYTSVH